MSSSPVRFDTVALDTPDPAGLARFYCDLLGWHVERGDDHLEVRSTLGPRLNRARPVLREVLTGGYRRFGAGRGSAVLDLIRR